MGEKSIYINNYEKFFIDLIYFIDALIRNDIFLSQVNKKTSLSMTKSKIANKNDKVLLDKLRNTKISKIIALSFASLINVY